MNSNPDQPLVSVVVLTFNRRQLLSETLHSILSQTVSSLELIVVDNMSSDGTSEYLAGLGDSRVVYLRHPNNGVLAVNRNLGIRHARGKYLAFCDDDDTWLPDKLRMQLDLLESKPSIAVCFTNILAVHDDSDPGRRVFRRFPRRVLFDWLIWKNFICNSSVLIRKSVIDEIGLLNENPDLTPYEDYDLWLRIGSCHPISGLDEPLVRYRVHGASYSAQLAHRELIVIRVLRAAMAGLRTRRLMFMLSIALRYVKYLFLSARST